MRLQNVPSPHLRPAPHPQADHWNVLAGRDPSTLADWQPHHPYCVPCTVPCPLPTRRVLRSMLCLEPSVSHTVPNPCPRVLCPRVPCPLPRAPCPVSRAPCPRVSCPLVPMPRAPCPVPRFPCPHMSTSCRGRHAEPPDGRVPRVPARRTAQGPCPCLFAVWVQCARARAPTSALKWTGP